MYLCNEANKTFCLQDVRVHLLTRTDIAHIIHQLSYLVLSRIWLVQNQDPTRHHKKLSGLKGTNEHVFDQICVYSQVLQ